MEFLIVLAILCVVVLIVSAPLRRAAAPDAPDTAAREQHDHQLTELAELEAAREAKYREIRDAELDHRTGKLSDADYQALDQSLRAEAIEILRALDRAAPAEADAGTEAEPAANGTPSSYHRHP